MFAVDRVHAAPSRVRLVCIGSTLVWLLVAGGSSAWGQFDAKQSAASPVEKFGSGYAEVEAAVADFKQGDLAACREKLVAARDKHPQLPPADVMLTMLHLSAGKTAPAMSALDRAVVNNSSDPEAYIILADLALRDGQRTVADLGYRQAQSLLSTFAADSPRAKHLQLRVHAGLASLHELREQYDLAEQQLESWSQLDPTNPIPYGSLGRIRFQLKQYDKAREAFAKLSEVEENAPPVELAMGRLFHDAGLRDEAVKQMTAASAARPADVKVRLFIAQWGLAGGYTELAKENIAAARKLDSDSPEAIILAARLARIENEDEKAETLLNQAVLRSPNNFIATNELARVLGASSDEAKRQTSLQYALRNYAAHGKSNNKSVASEAIVTYAWSLLRNGRADDAFKALSQVPDGSTISAENAYLSGQIYAERGNKAAAIGALQAAVAAGIEFPGRAVATELLDKLSQP